MKLYLQALFSAAAILLASQAQAITIKIPGERAGHWDFTLMGSHTGSSDFKLDSGAEIDVDGNWGWGFSFGYNFTNHWNLGFELAFHNNNRFSAKGGVQESGASADDSLDGKIDSYRGQINATYHFMEGNFTPFVVGGIGWQFTDTNVIKSVSSGCVWYPWWGWVCGNFAQTYNDTSFSYNLGLGLRWDVTDGIFLRGSYGRQWIRFSDAKGTPANNIGRLELGFMF